MPDLEVTITPQPTVNVEVTNTEPPVVTVSTTNTQIVTQYITGPQGPPGTAGSLGEITDVNTTAKIDRSLLYYDAASAQFRADATITKTTITDGGNF